MLHSFETLEYVKIPSTWCSTPEYQKKIPAEVLLHKKAIFSKGVFLR
jgi:hypothetical protein